MPSAITSSTPSRAWRDVVDALGVVGGADPVLGDQQRQGPAGVVPGAPQAVGQGGRVELVAHIEHGHPRLGPGPPVGPDALAGVDLHAQEVVARRWRRGRRPRSGGACSPAWPRRPDAAGSRSWTGSGPPARPGPRPGWPPPRPGARRSGSAPPPGRGPCRSCPEGTCPPCQPMTATTLGSLMVQARVITSPERPGHHRRQKRPKRSTAAPLSQPPWAASQRGVVKWWKVTTGSMPRSRSVAAQPSIVLQRGPRDLPLGGFDPAPFDREAVVVQTEARPPGRRPRPSGPTSRRRPRRARRTRCPARARTPTSRCWRCRPRSGGPRWPCPR